MPRLEYAVVLSAGLGTRLKDKTVSCPKVMLPFAGKPLLGHHLEWLRNYGVRRVFLNLHYMPESIREYCGDGSRFGVEITYSYEPRLRGTAGALKAFRDELDRTVLVHYGDVYSEVDLKKFYDFHRSKRADATLVVHPTNRPHDSDVVVIDEEARVLSVHHKPGTNEFGNIGNAASKMFEPGMLAYIPEGDEPSDFIQDVIPPAIADGHRVYAYDTAEFLMDMGTPDRHEKLQSHLADRR